MSVFLSLLLAWFYFATVFTTMSILSTYFKTKSWSEAVLLGGGTVSCIKIWAVMFPLMPILYTTLTIRQLFGQAKP